MSLEGVQDEEFAVKMAVAYSFQRKVSFTDCNLLEIGIGKLK